MVRVLSGRKCCLHVFKYGITLLSVVVPSATIPAANFVLQCNVTGYKMCVVFPGKLTDSGACGV